MRNAKNGQWWISNPQRALANNSAAYTEKPEIEIFLKEWLTLIESKSGERGIFNRVSATKKASSTGRRKVDGYQLGTNPCLSGDTLIAVADGRNAVSIKQLAEEGKDIPVYCLNDKDEIVIRKMVNPRITGYQVPIYEIEIENGHKIRTTNNHKFLVNTKGYIETRDLHPGDSLSIMTKYQSKNNTNNYWVIQSKGVGYKEHRLISEYHQGSIPNGYQVHHNDGNSLNNTPDNLNVVSIHEHNMLHNKTFTGENVSEENNPNANPVSNDEIREHAINLVKTIKKPFSQIDWALYAKNNGLPQSFSSWRKSHLGSIEILSRWAAIEAGVIMEEYKNLDPRQIKKLSDLFNQGYDVKFENKSYIFTKTCSCGNVFKTPNRENMYCSYKCHPEEWKQYFTTRVRDGQKIFFDKKKQGIREQQAIIFHDLKNSLGRDPWKKEWIDKCKTEGLSYEISRPSSPFVSFSELKKYATDFNHKVISIKFVGYENVYNGTVEEYHNFFVGGWEEKKRKGEGNKLVFLNNRQCRRNLFTI